MEGALVRKVAGFVSIPDVALSAVDAAKSAATAITVLPSSNSRADVAGLTAK